MQMSMSATADHDPKVDKNLTPSKVLSLDSNIKFERLEDIPYGQMSTTQKDEDKEEIYEEREDLR